MSEQVVFTPLNHLKNGVDGYKVRVKVHIVWKKFYRSNPTKASSLELVLVDDEGNKIRAGMEKETVSYYEKSFSEGRFLVLSRFKVIDSTDDYVRFINNPCKIMISKLTKVQKCEVFEFKNDIFRVVSYDQVNQRMLSSDEIFDVVGRVVSVIRFTAINDKNGQRKRLDFKLQSNSGDLIRCALWGDHAIRLLAIAKKCHADKLPVVALIHNSMLKDWEGYPQVNNIFFGTRLYVNEEVYPVSQYTTLFEAHPNRNVLFQIPTMDPDFEEDESSVTDKFKKTRAVYIEEIVNLPKDVQFVIVGKVSKLFDDDGWFQQLCCKCEKRLIDSWDVDLEKKILWCEKCSSEMQWIPKIRTNMIFKDDTQSCEMTLFDSQLSKLCNRSTAWLNARAGACVDPYDVPAEVNGVMCQTFVILAKKTDFNVSKNYRVYTVMDATDDVDVLNAVLSNLDKRVQETKDLSFDGDEFKTPDSLKILNTLDMTRCPDTGSSILGGETTDDGKRKSESPLDKVDDDTPTGGTTMGIGSMKIPKMEQL